MYNIGRRRKHDSGLRHVWHFLVGLMAGTMAGAAAMLVIAPQSGEKTRAEIKAKGLELKDEAADGITEASQRIQEEAAVWQQRGRGVTEALSASKDDIAQAVSASKDRVVAAAVNSNEPNGRKMRRK